MTPVQGVVVVLTVAALIFGIGGWYLYRTVDLGTSLDGSITMGYQKHVRSLERQIHSLIAGTALVGGVLVPLIYGCILFRILNARHQPNAARISLTTATVMSAGVLLIVFGPALLSLFYR